MLPLLIASLVSQHKDIVNDDRDVILQVIKMYRGNIFQTWNTDSNHRIILNSRFWSKTRDDFERELDGLIQKDEPYVAKCQELLNAPKAKISADQRDWLKSMHSEMNSLLNNLRHIQQDQLNTEKYVPPPIVPLKQMSWPPTINLKDNPNPWTDPYLNGQDKYGYDNAYLSAYPPSYSKGGKYVFVKMYAAGDPEPLRIFAFFKRIQKKWVLSAAYTRVY